MKFRSKMLFTAAASALILGAFPLTAYAQDSHSPSPATPSPTPATPGPSDDSNLQDIVVTAQSRPEKLQSVPISAAVATGSDLRAANVTSVQSLTQTLPGVSVVSGGRTDRLFLRGVGTGNNPGLEQSVSLFVDGVYHGRSRSSRASFLDLDRVEVLKGPQTTYFGNNAIAGAISVVTQRPGKTWAMDARAAFGQDNEYALEIGAGGPISDTIGIRIAGLVSGFDGYTVNLADGSKLGGQRNRAVRGTIVWQPSDAFDLTLKAEHGDDNRPGGLPLQIINCPPAAPFTGPRGFCATAISTGQETKLDNRATLTPGTGSDLETQEYVATANYRFGGGLSLTSITAFSKYRYTLALDLDELAAPLFSTITDERYRQFTEEARLASDPTNPLSFVLGGYYLDYANSNDTEYSYTFLSGNIAGAPPFAALIPSLPLGQSLFFDEHGKTYSAYGSVMWRITPHLRVTAGGRWTKADKRLTQTVFFGQGAQTYGSVTPLSANLTTLANAFGASARLGYAGVLSFKRSDSDFTPSVNIQYEFSPRAMVYASYANGFKAGGIDGADTTGIAANFPFNPETVDAFEIGAKTRFGNVQFNAAVFLSNYHNRQVSVSQLSGNGTAINDVRNAAESRSKGVEFDVRWAALRDLTFGLSGTFLDSKYLSYADAGATALQILRGQLTQDLSGQRTEFAPKFSGRFDAAYAPRIGADHRLHVAGSLFRTSSYSLATSDDPNLAQPGYWRVDGQIGFGRADDRWVVSVVARNLTDQKILTFGSDLAASPGSYAVAVDRGRSIVGQVQMRF